MKTKKELRNIAKEALVDALAKAYYSVTDGDDYELTDEEVSLVVELMNKYGSTMCKSINKEYFTY